MLQVILSKRQNCQKPEKDPQQVPVEVRNQRFSVSKNIL